MAYTSVFVCLHFDGIVGNWFSDLYLKTRSNVGIFKTTAPISVLLEIR